MKFGDCLKKRLSNLIKKWPRKTKNTDSLRLLRHPVHAITTLKISLYIYIFLILYLAPEMYVIFWSFWPFFEINKILSEKNDGYKVLYYPIYDEHQTVWSQGHLISDFTAKSSQIPTFDLVSNYNNIGELLYFLPYNN